MTIPPREAHDSWSSRRRVGVARPSVIAALLATSTLAFAGLALDGAGRSEAPTIVPRSMVAAQSAEAELRIGTPYLSWPAPPGVAVRAELLRDGGVIARSLAPADDSGRALLKMHVPSMPDRPRRQRGGDRVHLAVASAPGAAPPVTPSIQIELPALAIGVDGATGDVAGMAPPGGRVQLRPVAGAGGPIFLEADADGRFVGAAPWLEAGLRGEAKLLTPTEQVAFIAPFAATGATITLGSPRVEGLATPGETIDPLVARTTLRRDQGSSVPVTRLIPGTRTELDGSGPRSAPGAFALVLRDPVQPGDRVSLTRRSAWLDDSVLASTAVTTSISILTRDRVAGLAPAGEIVTVELRGPEGQQLRSTVTADEAGRWEQRLAGPWLQPGWWGSATIALPGGLRQRVVTAVPRVRVHLHGAGVDGYGPPGATAKITILDGTGHHRAGPWQAPVDHYGWFSLSLMSKVDGREQPRLIRPGEAVAVDFLDADGRGGDPLILSVPAMTAVADSIDDSLAGTAPAGESLILAWPMSAPGVGGEDEPSARPFTRTVRVGSDGRWRLELDETLDLEPRDAGTVTLLRPDQNQVSLAWAAVGLSLRIGATVVEGNAPPWRAVSLTLRAPGGAVVARGAARAGESGRWKVELRDALGSAAELREEDRLHANIGDEQDLEVELPRLRAVVHVADDVVAGSAPANAAIRVTVDGSEDGVADGVELDTVVDAAGTFAVELADRRDLRFNDRVGIALEIGPHEVTRWVSAPGLRLQLSTGRLIGSLEPRVAAEVRVERAGAVIARAATRAAEDATFDIGLRAEDGKPLEVEPGDRILVTAAESEAAQEVSLEVPRLEVQAQLDGDITGHAPTDGRLRVEGESVYPDAVVTGGSAAPVVRPDGGWRLAPGVLSITPGTRHKAILARPSGHIVERRNVVPIVSVEVGGARVCGHGQRDAVVELSRQPGAASSEGKIDLEHGVFRLRLREPEVEGEPAREAIIAAGDRLTILGGGIDAQVDVPWLAGEVDWERGEVLIDGVPGTEVSLLQPAGDCRGEGPWQSPGTPSASLLGRHRLGETGRARAVVSPEQLAQAEGHGLTLVTRNPEGHRIFAALRPARADLHAESERIDGTAPQGTRVSATLLGPDDSLRADAVTDADAAGRFTLRLSDSSGEPVAMTARDRLRLRFGRAGATEVILGLEPLSFDRDGPAGLTGVAAPEREILLQLRLRDNRLIALTRRADEIGRWTLPPEAIPPRAGWALADVVGARASVGLDRGHRLLTETEGFSAWLVGERSTATVGRRLFLPRLVTDTP